MRLTDAQRRLVRDLALEVVYYRQRFGVPIPEQVRAFTSAMSVSGRTDLLDGAQSAHDGDQWISAAQAGAILGLTARTVRRRGPTLGGRKPGREWMFRLTDIEEHANGRSSR